jgi:GH24 family phage-related lysozyme (muramidase)
MKTSAKGRAKIKEREGERLTAYRDSKGIPTIGVGHIAGVKMGQKITAAESDRLLAADLRIAEAAINETVTVPLTQDQFDALVSMVFNIGAGGWRKSTCLRRLNAGDYAGCARAMMMWNKPPEITGRRRGEMVQFLGAPRRCRWRSCRARRWKKIVSADEPAELVENDVSTSDSFAELRGKLATGADLVSKAQMAADSDVVRVGRRLVKGTAPSAAPSPPRPSRRPSSTRARMASGRVSST